MYKCEAIINVNGHDIKLGNIDSELDVSPLFILDYIKIRSGIRLDILKYSEKKRFIPFKSEDLIEGILPNKTLKEIVDALHISHNEKIDLSTKVLAVSKFNIGGYSYYGKRVITPRDNGKFEEVYVVNPNDEEQITRLVNLLQLKYKLEHLEEFPVVQQLFLKYSFLLDSVESFKLQSLERFEKLKDFDNIEQLYLEAQDNYKQFKADNKEQEQAYKKAKLDLKDFKLKYLSEHSTEYIKYKNAKDFKNSDDYKTADENKKKETREIIKTYEDAVKLFTEELQKQVDLYDKWYKNYKEELESKKVSEDLKNKYNELKVIKSIDMPNLNGSLALILIDYLMNKKSYEGLIIIHPETKQLKTLPTLFDEIIKVVNTEKAKKENYSGLIDIINNIKNVEKISSKLYIDVAKLINRLPEIINVLENIENKTDDLILFLDLCKQVQQNNLFKPIKNDLELRNLLKSFIDTLVSNSEGSFYCEVMDFDPRNTRVYIKTGIEVNSDRYGWDFETIRSFQKVGEYRGYKIFKGIESSGKEYYIIDNNIICPLGYNTKYISKDAAKEAIKKRIESIPLYLEAKLPILKLLQEDYINLRYPKRLNQGLVVSVMDINLDLNILNYLKANQSFLYNYLFGGYSYTQVILDLLNKILVQIDLETLNLIMQYVANGSSQEDALNKAITVISNKYPKLNFSTLANTPEKLVLFIYKLGEILLSNEAEKTFNYNTIKEALNNIPNIKHNFYIVNDSFKKGFANEYKTFSIKRNLDGTSEIFNSRTAVGFLTLMFKIPPVEISEEINYKEKTIIIKPLMEKISDIFKSKLKVDTLLLTKDLISKLFGPEVAKEKAFISNNIVYINLSLASIEDLLHEYSHLLLGILKSYNYDSYMTLIQMCSESKLAQNTIAYMQKLYKGLSLVDIMEEAFAKLFAQYLIYNNDSNLELTLKEFTDNLLGKNKLVLRHREEYLEAIAKTKSEKELLLENATENEAKIAKKDEELKKLNIKLADTEFKQIFFGGDEADLSSLMRSSLGSILSTFARNIGDFISSEFSLDPKAILYRKISNKITQLLNLRNKDLDRLTEKCE